MNGLNDSYVESVIRKAIAGRKRQLVDENGWVATIPAKTVVDIYVTRSGKEVAAYDGKLWYIAEVEKRAGEKKAGRPNWVPGPSHPWKKFVINPKKS